MVRVLTFTKPPIAINRSRVAGVLLSPTAPMVAPSKKVRCLSNSSARLEPRTIYNLFFSFCQLILLKISGVFQEKQCVQRCSQASVVKNAQEAREEAFKLSRKAAELKEGK